MLQFPSSCMKKSVMTVLKIILVEELSSEAVKELLAVGSPHNPHVGYIICCTFLWIRSDYWLDS